MAILKLKEDKGAPLPQHMNSSGIEYMYKGQLKKQVCLGSLCHVARVLYFCILLIDTIGRSIEDSSEAGVEERKRYAFWHGWSHTSCSDWR